MGALSDYAAYKAGVEKAKSVAALFGTSGAISGTLEWWAVYGNWGPPTTAAALNASSNLSGKLVLDPALINSFSAQAYIGAIESANNQQVFPSLLIDRLTHQGGLSGIVTGAQTTNLPTAALTRYTSGAGVCIGVNVYTNVGATATTLTASYTNQEGTAGKTTKAVQFGGTSRNAAATCVILPLADGDTGVRSVESVTIAASTATAGSFGVFLFKPLTWIPPGVNVRDYQVYIEGLQAGRMIELTPNACLTVLSRSTSTFSAALSLRLLEA